MTDTATLPPLVEEIGTRDLKEIHSHLLRAEMYADDSQRLIKRSLGETNTYWGDTRNAQQRLSTVLETVEEELERRGE